jgi:pSer/pThr/pTyr-binding forkhead associated (FHA) protein
MKTITLGREGDQPFEIKQGGVSSQHARIIIDDNQWTLEDMGSSNGTFIIDANGKERQVGRITISPQTLICLGPNNANGCTFYARCVIDAKRYTDDFDYLEERDVLLQEREARADETAKMVRKGIGLVSVVALIASFFVPDETQDKSIRMGLLRVGSLISAVSSWVYDPSKQKKKLKAMRENLFKCPNPACSHNLTSKEIHNRRCSKCKAQG